MHEHIAQNGALPLPLGKSVCSTAFVTEIERPFRRPVAQQGVEFCQRRNLRQGRPLALFGRLDHMRAQPVLLDLVHDASLAVSKGTKRADTQLTGFSAIQSKRSFLTSA
jgi:hypothetical protein